MDGIGRGRLILSFEQFGRLVHGIEQDTQPLPSGSPVAASITARPARSQTAWNRP
jgi:hypothetical protein